MRKLRNNFIKIKNNPNLNLKKNRVARVHPAQDINAVND